MTQGEGAKRCAQALAQALIDFDKDDPRQGKEAIAEMVTGVSAHFMATVKMCGYSKEDAKRMIDLFWDRIPG